MPRYLIHSHDTYGLGHFRRCALIANGLTAADDDNEVLIVTGSPRAQSFRLGDRIDTVTLPSVTKDEAGSYHPRKLSGTTSQLVSLRAGLVAAAVEGFGPDVILVDHSPLGMGGELTDLIDGMAEAHGRPRLVLGLRDIVDEAAKVSADWHRDGVWERLEAFDQVLVYGDRNITTTACELGLERRLSTPVIHTGYVAPTMPEAHTDEPFILVTPGGGGDGQGLLRSVLEAIGDGATRGLRTVVVTGPLLSSRRRAELMAKADRLPSVELIEFTDSMRSLIASAAGVISMAGYNTVTEELAARVPALLVPRSFPRLEQTIRAQRLDPASDLQHTPLDQLDSATIARFVDSCATESVVRHSIDLGGVATAAGALTALARTGLAHADSARCEITRPAGTDHPTNRRIPSNV
ncbi:MAG: hypothetical protein KDB16_17265 [Acidimicrobiales bacterium]|nr:hypothetical protein [Acidimicrobiales bacterium]